MGQMRASLAEGVTQLRQRDIGVSGEMVGQLTGRGDQRFLAARRERQHSRPLRSEVVRSGAASRGRRLGEHDVGVGAAESERVHSDYPSLVAGKWPTRSRYVDLQLREGDVSRWSLEMQIGWDVAVF